MPKASNLQLCRPLPTICHVGRDSFAFAAGLPNVLFRADRYVSLKPTSHPVDRFYQEQEQIDGGKMDRFVAVSDTGALPST